MGDWKYLLINGKSKQVQIEDPQYENGILVSISGLKPAKIDLDGKEVPPTVEDANAFKRKIYIEFFKKPFKNILVLSGAGSSMDVGGPSMAELWEKAENMYKDGLIDGFKVIRESVNYKSNTINLEALLSQIDGFGKYNKNTRIKIGEKEMELSVIKNEIFELIRKNCTIEKPTTDFPHRVFLEKLLQRKQTSPRVKVFTLNYDLLFEYASTELNAIVIDGFSFTLPRTFSGRFYDYDIVQREGSKLQEEDNFIQRVFHLHKLHGSLNWERDSTTNALSILEKPNKPLMVYPRDAKYEDSYEQPFFEMMARFQRNLRQNNDTILICIGYSFNDKHINAAIEEALNQNPAFRLVVIDPGFNKDDASMSMTTIIKAALDSERILLVSETFKDFATYFPEMKTYESDSYKAINLRDEHNKN